MTHDGRLEDSPELQMPVAFSLLETKLKDLESLCGMLEERLSVVSLPKTDSRPAIAPPEPDAVPYVQVLQGFSKTLAGILAGLQDTLNRLQF